MLSIGNYSTSQFIQRHLSNQIKAISEATERLSSGKRVNTASDDPFIIGTYLDLNANSFISKGIQNGGEAKILSQTADSGIR